MKSIMSVVVILLVSVAAQAAWMPVGVSSGGIAVYYNTVAQGQPAENPYNQAYLKAQLNNSKTLTNGAAFVVDSSLAGPTLFNDLGQYGFDLVVQAPTSSGDVPTPILNAYDNGNNTVAGRILAGPVAWSINDYKSTSGGSGPSNALGVVINSIIRGGSGTCSIDNIVPIIGGYQVTFAATMTSDAIFHWYNPAFPDNPMSMYAQGGQYWSGNFRANGTLTYLVANDSTAGMDFYSGNILVEAEVIPEPITLALLSLGGLMLRRRTR
jgi:hypothetical protein